MFTSVGPLARRGAVGLLFLLTLLSTGPAAAALGDTLGGRIVDAETGAPLVNANIYVQGGEQGTVSTSGGYFTLTDCPTTPFVLVVTFVGYEPTLLPVDPAALSPDTELQITLQPRVYAEDEIVVTASRYGSDVHLSHTNLPREEIARRQSEVDIPLLLEGIPGVYASSDAGNGIGYTYLKIRGFDQRRIGVLVNGIPLNDPEDHQVYWLDIPDLAASLEDVQVQRGVTNSLGGMPSFGGTVNLVTNVLSVEPKGRLSFHAGSYGTAKQSLSYQTGLLGGRFSSALRVSHLGSDGYRDRSASDQWGVFWSGRFLTSRTTTQVNIYTGRELTQQSWLASDEATLATRRTANPETYHNAVDDFRQPHFELHHDWKISERILLENSFFLIHGEGFYENFINRTTDWAQIPAGNFSLDYFLGVDSLDVRGLTQRLWVDKNQWGWIPRLTVDHGRGRLLIGGDAYTFRSTHWGDIHLVEGFTPDEMVDGLRFQDWRGNKDAGSAYLNERYELFTGLTLLLDLQYQHRRYRLQQSEVGNFRGENRHAYTVEYGFFNPKGGFYWQLPGRPAGGRLGFYAHAGIAHREPATNDLFNSWPGPEYLYNEPLFDPATRRLVYKADGVTVDYVEWVDPLVNEEKVYDYELGAAFRAGRISLTVNGYWMDFRDEIVPLATVDNRGVAVKGNAEQSYHRGIEVGLTLNPLARQYLSFSGSKSWNTYQKFISYEPVYDEDWNFIGNAPRDYAGNPIPLFPQYLAMLSWRADWGPLTSDVRYSAVGRQYLDNTGLMDRTIEPYEVLDLLFTLDLGRLGYGGLKGARAELRLRNLLDEEYETNGYYYGGKYLIPAAKRNFLVGVTYDF